MDVGSDSAVEAFAKAIGNKPIDILINNAAIHVSDSLGHIGFDSIRRQFETNALGPIRVTRRSCRSLHGGAKVAIITSRSGSIGDNGSGGNYGYRMSKAAVNMAGVNLAIDLKPRGIVVALLHPGMVRTGMGVRAAAIDPRRGAPAGPAHRRSDAGEDGDVPACGRSRAALVSCPRACFLP